MSPKTLTAKTEPLALQLGYTHQLLKANTEGLTHEDSLVQPQPAGNCLNWVVGHIAASRNDVLGLLGKPAIWGDEQVARYGRQSGPITGPEDVTMPFSQILADLDASQEAVLGGLRELSNDDLSATVPWGSGEISKADALAGLVFHEAYHVGQTGLLRRIAGKESLLKG